MRNFWYLFMFLQCFYYIYAWTNNIKTSQHTYKLPSTSGKSQCLKYLTNNMKTSQNNIFNPDKVVFASSGDASERFLPNQNDDASYCITLIRNMKDDEEIISVQNDQQTMKEKLQLEDEIKELKIIIEEQKVTIIALQEKENLRENMFNNGTITSINSIQFGTAGTCENSVLKFKSQLSTCSNSLLTYKNKVTTLQNDLNLCSKTIDGRQFPLACTDAELGICESDLGLCKSISDLCVISFSNCDNDLTSCENDLDTANNDLDQCNKDLVIRTGQLATCNINLGIRTSELATCNDNLNICEADLAASELSLSLTIADLATCGLNLLNCQSNAVQSVAIIQTLSENFQNCETQYNNAIATLDQLWNECSPFSNIIRISDALARRINFLRTSIQNIFGNDDLSLAKI